jgi:hypothetical protein
MSIYWTLAKPWQLVYEGEADDAAAKEVADKEAAEKAAKTTFTQDEVNKFLAEERRKNQTKTESAIKELEVLKKNKGLSEKEKETLTKQIEDLKATVMSKEELAAKETKRLKEEGEKKEKELSTERDNWKSKYHDSTITRALMDGARQAGALRMAENQIVTLLKGSTRLVEVLDADDAPTGNFIPKVKLDDVDKDGKPVTLDLTVPEVFKRMKERTDDFGNLFESTLKGGLGGSSGKGGKQKEVKDMTPAEYAEHRKTIGLGRRGPITGARKK